MQLNLIYQNYRYKNINKTIIYILIAPVDSWSNFRLELSHLSLCERCREKAPTKFNQFSHHLMNHCKQPTVLILRRYHHDTILDYTHTHTRLTAPFPGLSGWASTGKVKPIWILLKKETVSSSGISWAMCKSASCSRQITMPAPYHSSFLQANQQWQSTEGIDTIIN